VLTGSQLYLVADFKNENFNFKTNIIMKTKSSIRHHTFTFIYVLLVAVVFCGCGNEPKTEQLTGQGSNWRGFEVIVVDSCEYLNQFKGFYSGYIFTHKGNCKFCIERSKK